MKQIFVRLEDAEGERLEALAKQNDRSLSAEARFALRAYVQANGSGAPLTEADARAATTGG